MCAFSDKKANHCACDVTMHSTDENNWRNDYPDEEDSPHSSDSERDNRREYRNWQDTYSMSPHYCQYMYMYVHV